MKLFKRIIFVLLILFLSGCVSISKVMQSWEGHHMSELISSWGPPTREMSDGSGGRILIYESPRAFTSPGYATTNVYSYPGHATGQTTYYPPTTSGYVASRCFWVDSNGRIYRWSWKGL